MLYLEIWPQTLDSTNGLFIKAVGDSVGVSSAGVLLAKWYHGDIFSLCSLSLLLTLSSLSFSFVTLKQ